MPSLEENDFLIFKRTFLYAVSSANGILKRVNCAVSSPDIYDLFLCISRSRDFGRRTIEFFESLSIQHIHVSR